MSEIINFPNGEHEQEECCPFCEMVNEFIEDAIQSDSNEELADIIRTLAHICKDIGFRDSLVNDIEVKMNVLRHLDGECDCEE